MLDDNTDAPTSSSDDTGATSTSSTTTRTRRRASSRPAGPPSAPPSSESEPSQEKRPTQDESGAPAAKKTATRKRAVKKAAAESAAGTSLFSSATEPSDAGAEDVPKRAPRKRAAKKAAPAAESPIEDSGPAPEAPEVAPLGSPIFQVPEPVERPARSRAAAPTDVDTDQSSSADQSGSDGDEADTPSRRRRRRGGRRRRKSGPGEDGLESMDDIEATGQDATDKKQQTNESADDDPSDSESAEDGESATTRRRRRRRRRGEDSDVSPDDPANTVVRVREPRSVEDEITSVSGSTRLEAKKQRRREGREAGRRRAPIVSEAEFLARRESVKREMVIRQRKDLTQIAVLEDDVLVEHYVARESQTSLIGNVYLGRVQNVLPSMEAAFVDIGKGRNAVLYAGEVDWKTLGNGKQRKIEEVLKSGQTVLVQVTKDPIGHKGARLTSQISLAGRFLVYVPGGQTSGISRKLPDTERSRLKNLLKDVLPDEAGVIIRTAAEGASEEQLTRDVTALTARWDDIQGKVKTGNSPALLYGEPDLTIKVVRDLFNEDFATLVVEGDDAWDMIQAYVQHVAPDLSERLERWSGDGADAFSAYRIDEQIAKALDRKVWLPSGGSLIIDRTEAMTVVDVNTGKFTGSGGNLEETVTKNNLEAAEEIVRQLRLRDIGGIIVIDFIDMVLEGNRDLVLRRLVECLGRDRTRHQVAEVTSLGLVQMTRKRIGTGLLEAFSETCDHCQGRGLIIHSEPVESTKHDDGPARGGRRRAGKADPTDHAPAAKGGRKSTKKKAAPAVSDQGAASDQGAESDGAVTPSDAADVPVLTADGQAP